MDGEALPQTVLVTGASGFVGSAVLAALRAAGFSVRAASRQPRSEPDWVTVGPLGPDTDWSAALHGTDAVVHLAAHVHVMERRAAAADDAFLRANRDGTVALARAAAQAGVKIFVFMSSVKVNGEGREAPYSEADGPVPFDAYARSKLAAELGLAQVGEETGMKIVVLRPPLVYGRGVGANFLQLVRLIDRGLPLPFAAVRNRRSMIYVGNLASAVVASLGARESGTYLISDGEDVSTPELVRRIAKALGKRATLLPVPPSAMHAVAGLLGRGPQLDRLLGSLSVSSAAFRQTFSWRPPFTMAQGLAALAEWYRNREDETR